MVQCQYPSQNALDQEKWKLVQRKYDILRRLYVCSSAIQNWTWDLQFCRPMIFFCWAGTQFPEIDLVLEELGFGRWLSLKYIDPPNWLEPVSMTKIVVVFDTANLLSFLLKLSFFAGNWFFFRGFPQHFFVVALIFVCQWHTICLKRKSTHQACLMRAFAEV